MNLFIIAVFTLVSFDVSRCWVINNIDARVLSQDLLDEDLSEEDLARLRFSLIFPGTKWCGAGDIADGYDDLGPSKEADMCCREHDFCPDTIPAGESKHNLTNEAFYTRLSCDCDEKFHQCLRDANTKTAKTIGVVYFNILSTKCYREDYPVIECVKRGGWLNSKCIEYSYDTSSQPRYQWFDVPPY